MPGFFPSEILWSPCCRRAFWFMNEFVVSFHRPGPFIRIHGSHFLYRRRAGFPAEQPHWALIHCVAMAPATRSGRQSSDPP